MSKLCTINIARATEGKKNTWGVMYEIAQEKLKLIFFMLSVNL